MQSVIKWSDAESYLFALENYSSDYKFFSFYHIYLAQVWNVFDFAE
jgi:hypothetical protein